VSLASPLQKAGFAVGAFGCAAALVSSNPGPKPFALCLVVLCGLFYWYERRNGESGAAASTVAALGGLACLADVIVRAVGR
jgi:hypothetical protein